MWNQGTAAASGLIYLTENSIWAAPVLLPWHQVDNMLAQAQSVSRGLLEQRRIFTNVQDKLGTIGEKFPAINGLLNAVRRRKSKVWYERVTSMNASHPQHRIVYIKKRQPASLVVYGCNLSWLAVWQTCCLLSVQSRHVGMCLQHDMEGLHFGSPEI